MNMNDEANKEIILKQIPNDLWAIILSSLSDDQIFNFTIVCKFVANLVNTNTVWKMKLQNLTGIDLDEKKTPQEFKQLYFYAKNEFNKLKSVKEDLDFLIRSIPSTIPNLLQTLRERFPMIKLLEKKYSSELEFVSTVNPILYEVGRHSLNQYIKLSNTLFNRGYLQVGLELLEFCYENWSRFRTVNMNSLSEENKGILIYISEQLIKAENKAEYQKINEWLHELTIDPSEALSDDEPIDEEFSEDEQIMTSHMAQ